MTSHSPLAQVLRTAIELQHGGSPDLVTAIIDAAAKNAADQVEADSLAVAAICHLGGYWRIPGWSTPMARVTQWAARCTPDEVLTVVSHTADEAEWVASLRDRPAATAPSPLAQAEKAKRKRDLPAELGAVTSGYEALTSAPWYPAQAGDIVHVLYWGSLVDAMPLQGETYVVEHSDEEGGLVLRLLHADEHVIAPGAGAPGMVDDPLMELWMEGGPDCLTIVRNGRVVHGRTP
jgi:hypothetical protein